MFWFNAKEELKVAVQVLVLVLVLFWYSSQYNTHWTRLLGFPSMSATASVCVLSIVQVFTGDL